MPLRVVVSPGCSDILTEAELALQQGEVLIDTGKIAEALGYSPTDPNRNTEILRIAQRARGLAIVAAQEANLDGIVRTGNPNHVERLREQIGGGEVRTIALTRAEACRRIRARFPSDRDRQLLCEAGLDRYFASIDEG